MLFGRKCSCEKLSEFVFAGKKTSINVELMVWGLIFGFSFKDGFKDIIPVLFSMKPTVINAYNRMASIDLIAKKRETSWFLRSNGKRRNDLIHRPTNLPIVAASTLSGEIRKGYADYHIEVLKKTRQKFCEEISFRVKDKDVSLAKCSL
eukprot:Gb_22584 [translate_table: standard]